MEYYCSNSECENVDIRCLVEDLPMDVRYVESGDMVDCQYCNEWCECEEVE